MSAEKVMRLYSDIQIVEGARALPSDDSRLSQRASPLSRVAVDRMKRSVAEFSEFMTEILSDAPLSHHGFSVDQVQVQAFVDVEGGIGLLGANLSTTVQGGITFVWSRSEVPSPP